MAGTMTLPEPAALRSPARPGRRILGWLLIALIVAGLTGRLVRFGLGFPIWGDEAMVSNNFLARDYLGLTRGLEYAQVAPLLFLWSQLTAFRLLGSSEWSMRLGPLLAGIASLLFFWRLARRTLNPLAATLAVGMLAVARWPVTMSADAKPYSSDLLMALVLLVPAVEWLRRPQRIGWLALLALAAPIALLGSYPAVFVAGAVSLALLPTAWRSGWAGRGLFVAYNVLMFAAFAVSCWVVGREQLDPAHGSVNTYLLEYWADGFPPASPPALVRWLFQVHTGRMMAYPTGGDNGLSALTFLLFLVGAWTWWKGGRGRLLLLLCLAPFALNLLAAALHRYPYGACGRLTQHLAPSICLLAASGGGALIEWFVRSEAWRLRCAGALCALYGACVAVGLVMDLVQPYRDTDALWQRATVRAILAKVGPDDSVVIVQSRGAVQPTFRWYMDSGSSKVQWDGRLDERQLAEKKGAVWVVQFWLTPADKPDEAPLAFRIPPESGLVEAGQVSFASKPRVVADATLHCDVSRWAPALRRP